MQEKNEYILKMTYYKIFILSIIFSLVHFYCANDTTPNLEKDSEEQILEDDSDETSENIQISEPKPISIESKSEITEAKPKTIETKPKTNQLKTESISKSKEQNQTPQNDDVEKIRKAILQTKRIPSSINENSTKEEIIDVLENDVYVEKLNDSQLKYLIDALPKDKDFDLARNRLLNLKEKVVPQNFKTELRKLEIITRSSLGTSNVADVIEEKLEKGELSIKEAQSLLNVLPKNDPNFKNTTIQLQKFIAKN